MNAYTQGNTVSADVCQFRLLPLFQVDGEDLETNIPVFTRWSLDLTSRSIIQAQRDDRLSEFPRLDERYRGLALSEGDMRRAERVLSLPRKVFLIRLLDMTTRTASPRLMRLARTVILR